MRNEENINLIVRDKHWITSLSLTYETSTVCLFIIFQGNEGHKNSFFRIDKWFLIND